MDADEISISFTRSAKPPPSDAVDERATADDKSVTVTRQLGRSGCLAVTISHRPHLQDSLDIDPRKRRSYWKPRYFEPDLRELLPYTKVGTPLGATEDIDRFLRATNRFIPEYWPSPGSTVNVWSAADVDRKLSDLRAMDVILVPKSVYLGDNFSMLAVNSDLTVQDIDQAFLRKKAILVLSKVNMFPVWLPKPRNLPLYPEVQMMAEIAKQYHPVGEFRDYLIAEKRSNSGNPPVKVEQ
jgi:hypothetical protein